MKITSYFSLVLLTGAFCNVHASTLQFSTASGAQSAAGNPINILSTVTTATDGITVQLDNLLTDPTAIDQVITGISFVLNFQDTNALTLFSSSGQLIYAPVQGSAPVLDNTDTINHWGASSSNPTSSTTLVNLTSFTGGGTPSDGVIGNPGANGIYNNVNSSIANGHADPFILSQGIFVLSLTGVTSSTSVSSVVFTLGTSSSDTVASVTDSPGPSPVPEPGSWCMVLLGGVLVGAGYLKKSTSTPTA